MRSTAYHLMQPAAWTAPVVFSSPHSGRAYTPAFLAQTILDRQAIRSSEDAFVEELFGTAPDFGAPLIAAQAPRAYIDLNRSAEELDPAVVEGVARAAHNPRVASGLGVIPRVVAGGKAIYRGKIPLEEAQSRISLHWVPYHTALRALMAKAQREFGQAILIDCHSMPHEAIEAQARPGFARPEVVLGDRFGATASREVVDHVERAFRRADFRVARNAPFAGAYITQTYGRPSRGFHAVQVEIDRSLYMNESRVEKSARFDETRARLANVVAEIVEGLGKTQQLAAE